MNRQKGKNGPNLFGQPSLGYALKTSLEEFIFQGAF